MSVYVFVYMYQNKELTCVFSEHKLWLIWVASTINLFIVAYISSTSFTFAMLFSARSVLVVAVFSSHTSLARSLHFLSFPCSYFRYLAAWLWAVSGSASICCFYYVFIFVYILAQFFFSFFISSLLLMSHLYCWCSILEACLHLLIRCV